jgi:hypothetical protein
MRAVVLLAVVPLALASASRGEEPRPGPALVVKPDAFTTLVNPACSHCRDEARRRAGELRPDDRVLCWTRGYSQGGAIPMRFFLAPYRVISDSYGLFVYDPDAGYARGFGPSFRFRFHGWRNGVMVMRHSDGTLYSCLTGVAFDGPRKGGRLKPVPTLVSDWGPWLEAYPGAVAYHMFDKYRPVELPTKADPDSLRSRGTPDPRLKADEAVLGVWTGKAARAYPVAALERAGLLRDEVGGEPLVLLWEPRTRTASAYRPVASQPRKYSAPHPDADGISPPDEGTTLPPGSAVVPPRKLTLEPAAAPGGRFQDRETRSRWDVAGRCVAGALEGWTLDWVDSVQVKWYAWAAEHPDTSIHGAGGTRPKPPAAPGGDAKPVAGTAEFLRLLPKPFATLQAVDPQRRTATLLIEGEKLAKVWPVEPDAEVLVGGWWGRLEQLRPGDRVWAWLKLDRRRHPVGVVMLADEVSEWALHGSLRKGAARQPRFTAAQVEARRAAQKGWLRQRWLEEGLPGTLTIGHVFSGELELLLDHEAMRWGRSLRTGDAVSLTADPPIEGAVRSVAPWRERTVVRVVVPELALADLKPGQRLGLKMKAPAAAVEAAAYPPDISLPRSKAERVEWFLASVYCTCGVGKDTCTGHFYTLASCNPNGCGMPGHVRAEVAGMIDRGRTDREIFDELCREYGPLLLRPHLMP